MAASPLETKTSGAANLNANFTHHVCYLCGRWAPCEMTRCTHAVCVRILPCCDPRVLEKWTKEERARWQ